MNLASASGYIRLFLIQRSQYNDQKCHIVGQRKLSEMPIISLQLLTESAVIPFIFMKYIYLQLWFVSRYITKLYVSPTYADWYYNRFCGK